MVDFLVFEAGVSLVASVLVDSVVADFSVFASDFFELFGLLLVEGLVAVSAAGLFVVGGLFVVFGVTDAVEVAGVLVGIALGVPVAAGVVVAATDAVAAGVIVAAALEVAAGLALTFVDADVLVVVLGAVVVFTPVVVDALTPNVAGTVTP